MIGIKTVYSGTAAAMAKGMGATTAQLRIWLEDAYEAALWHWHRDIRPKHFQESAVAEYGYQPRQADYERGKHRSLGHNRPLVYSGDSERATERAYVKASGRSASLHMAAGNLTWNPGRGRVNMREELTAMTWDDKQEMAHVMERDMDRAIQSRHDYFERIIAA